MLPASRTVAVVALTLAPVLAGLLLLPSDFFARVEHETVNTRFQLRGEDPPPDDTLLIGIDRQSARVYARGWRSQGLTYPPYPSRAVWARTVKRLDRAGATAVVMAFFFGSIQPKANRDDARLVSAIRSSRIPVVVGLDCDSRTATGGARGQPSARGTLVRAGAEVGSLCVWSDDVVTQLPLTVFGKRVGASKGTQGLTVALSRALGKPVPLGAFQIPEYDPDTEPERVSWIDFSRSPKPVEEVSLFEAERAMSIDRLAKKVNGRVAVIGDTTYDPGFEPVRTMSPGDGLLYSGEIFALGTSTMLQGFPIREIPPWLGVVGIVVLGVVLPLSAAVIRPRSWGLFALGLFVALLVGAQLAFDLTGLIVPVVVPALTLLAGLASAFTITIAKSRRELVTLRERFADMDEQAVAAVLSGTVKSGRASTEEMVPGYRIEALIGRGASGNVYRATRLATGELVALKVVRPVLANDDDALGQFEREFQAARLIKHPNIVRILDEGTISLVYAASEYMPLGDLQKALDDRGPMGLDEVLAVGDDIAEALEVAHASGLIHRDLKPSNLFKGESGYKLGDFGIARLTGESTASAGAVGTIAYAAPEQLAVGGRGRIDVQTDVYGLAATLYALLTGRPPFLRDSLEETVTAKMEPQSVVLPSRLSGLTPVFSMAFATVLSDRQSSPIEFMRELRRAAEAGWRP